MQPVTAENVFARAWSLLSSNWVIIVPGFVVAIIVGIVTALLTPTQTYVGDNGYSVVRSVSAVGAIVVALVGILGAIISISYTTGMAGAAWQRGTTTLADGSAAFKEDAGRVLSAMFFLFLVGVVGALLAPFTLGLSILVLFFLFPYTMAAAVLGNLGGIDALRESYRIATQHVATTVIIIVVAAAIAIVGGLIAGVFHLIFLVGPLISAILNQIVLAYLTLVIVGVYLGYRNTTTLAAAGADTAAAAAMAAPVVAPAPDPAPPPAGTSDTAGPAPGV